MKKIYLFLIFLFFTSTLFSQIHIDQNGIKTSVISNLSANNTQPRRYEIAKVGYNSHHWQAGGLIIIEIFNNYFATGYQKYVVENGFGQGANSGNPLIKLIETQGINQSATVSLGAVYDMGNTYAGFANKILPIYCDVKDYASYKVRITYMQTKVDVLSDINQIKINENPQGTDIATFVVPTTSLSNNDINTLGNLRISGNGFHYIQNGNLGIGTITPSAKLNIEGDHGSSRFLLHANGNGQAAPYQADLSLWASEPGLTWSGVGIGNNIHNYKTGSGGLTLLNTARGGSYIRLLDNAMQFNVVANTGTDLQALSINSNGNVGIGTPTPEAKLDVNGYIQTGGGANNFYGFGQSSASKPIDVRTGPQYPYVFNWHTGLTFSAHSTYGGIRFYNQGYPNMYGEGVMVMAITNNNVGIGTTSPDAKLAVKGQIHAQEVKVDLQGALVPDYVFAKEYKLKSLAEVEAYVKTNSHLPEVPSAKEIEKNGLQLGEMNMVLLKKIEELTLHAIEQQKQIEFLKTENNTYKTLAERLTAIEKELTKAPKKE